MIQVTNAEVTVVTEDGDNDYNHRQLVETINGVARGSHWESVDYEYSSSRGDKVKTEANVTFVTEGDEKDRKHRKAVEKIQDMVNDSSFDERQLSFNTSTDSSWDPSDLGDLSDTEVEDHQVAPLDSK